MKVVVSWTGSVDIDTFIISSDIGYIRRERDYTSAPGGETFTFNSAVNNYPDNKFMVYADMYNTALSYP